ncbi:HAD family hydrolase [Craurococcus roseus]
MKPRPAPLPAHDLGAERLGRLAPSPPAAEHGGALHSFDVFDTLITRCFWRPEDLFVALGERLRGTGLLRADAAAFAARRAAAEAELRARPGVEEVDLLGIHQALAPAFGWNAAEARAAAEAEVDAEEEAIRPIAANTRLLARLQAEGAEVALLSDTYLDRAALLRLLRRAGIAVPPQRVFASSELGATKRTGRMFMLAAEALGVPPRRIVHRGDHPRSDVAVPRSIGIKAELCAAGAPTRYELVLHAAAARRGPPLLRSALAGGARAARLSSEPDGPHGRALRAVGAGVAGPLLCGFVLWALREARRDGLSRLHFVSRDGQILLRIAEALLGRLPWGVECRYLLGSRQAWHLPALEGMNEAALSWLADDAPRDPLRSVLARAELAPGRIGPALARHGFDSPAALDAPAPPARLRALLRDPEVGAALRPAVAERREAALGYLRQEGVLGAAGRAAIVDLGWHGRLQRSLGRLLEFGSAGGAGAGLTGFYMALRSRPAGSAPGEMRTFIDAPAFLERMNPVLLEIFCSADHGTVRRYEAAPGGRFEAVLAEPSNPRVLAWGLPALQDGVLAFAREVAEALARSGGSDADAWIDALREAGTEVFDAFRREPSAEEAEAFGGFPHADGQAHEAWADCAPAVGPLTRLRLGLGLRDAGYAGHWPEASVRRGGGALGEGLFALKRARARLFG